MTLSKQVAADIDTVINVFMNPDDYFPKSVVSYSYVELQKRVSNISIPLEDVLEIMKEEGLVEKNRPLSKQDDYTWSYTSKMTKLYRSGGRKKEAKKETIKNVWAKIGIIAAIVAAISGIADFIFNYGKK